MAKQKTVYSTWYRNLLRNSKIKKLNREKEQILAREQAKKSAEEELREKQRILRAIEDESRQDRKQRSQEYISNREMVRDFDGTEADSKIKAIVETPKERRKRLKDEKKIEKIRQKQLKKDLKEKSKVLETKTKNEGNAKKSENKQASDDENLRISLERKMVKMQRRREKENRRAQDEREKNRKFEEDQKAKQQAILKKQADKLLEEEYRKQERLRREKERADRQIEARRRKAAGDTFNHRLQERLRIFLKIYSFENLKDTINTYGYSYSIEEFAKQTVAIVAVVAAIAWFSKIRGFWFVFILIVTILAIPYLIYSWFNQMFNGKRFEMVQSYLSNILPLFMQKPKIRYALEEVSTMATGQMEAAIKHSIDYMDTTASDENVMKTALSFIETEFPNSRIKAVHKLLLDVEGGNSKDYTDVCENMYLDVEGWIRRVYGFQKDLKSRRTSLVVLCLFSLILNTVFTVMYGTSEIFNGFTENTLYQVSTTLFILSILATAILILTKLHGAWLIYDSNEKEETDNIRAYTYIHMNKPEVKKNDVISAIIFAAIGIFIVIGLNNKAGFVTFLLSLMFIEKGKITWNSKKKRVSKALMLEFPVWLRGIALNLHDMTVVNAIQESMNTCSYCFKKEIEKFFNEYNENPTSIKAFNNFLGEYAIEDVQASMKVLFTIQSMSAKEIKNQVSMLITRNQELLTKTETIQNQDSLGAAEALGYMPMILLTVQLLVSMVLMFIHIMNYMDEIMTNGLG